MAVSGGLVSLSATREEEGSKRRCRERPPRKKNPTGNNSKKRKNQEVLGKFMVEKRVKSPKYEHTKIMSRGFSLHKDF